MSLGALARRLSRISPGRISPGRINLSRLDPRWLAPRRWRFGQLPRPARRGVAAAGGLVFLLVAWSLLPAPPEPPSVTVTLPDSSDSAAVAGHHAGAPGQTEPEALPPVPDPKLIETSAVGPLPRIGEDGRLPRQVYARPADLRDDRPRIALIVTGLGLSPDASAAAIAALPADVSLAIDPYADAADAVVTAARADGHELLLILPLEPRDFPFSDPGPLALMTRLDADAIRHRLERVMARARGYVGLVSVADSGVEADREAVGPVLAAVAGRGLLYVDGRRSAGDAVLALADERGVPRLAGDLWIDDSPVAADIDAALTALERMASERAVAVGLARLYPVTLDRISHWAATLADRGFVLTPASAVAGRQFLEGP